MVSMDFGARMPGDRHCTRIDTLELKNHIERKLGRQKAEKYFNCLSRYLCHQLSKSEFDKLCIGLLGRENISLHNGLMRAIIRNACIAKSSPLKDGKGQSSVNTKVPNGYRSNLQSLCRGVFPQSPRKGRTPTIRERRSKDRPSPLGPHGKPQNAAAEHFVLKGQEQHSVAEILSLESRPHTEIISMEEGKEVEQGTGYPGIHSRCPLTAPFGVCLTSKARRKVLSEGPTSFTGIDTCYKNTELPDSISLKKILEQKLAVENLNVSTDSVNLLNNGLDVFMKRLIKPCLTLTALRSECRPPNKILHHASVLNGMRPFACMPKSSASITDFQVAMQSNPRILGDDWPVQLEKMYSSAPDYYMDG